VPHTHEQGADLGAEAIEHAVRGKPYGLPFAKEGEKLPENLYLADFYMRYGAFMLGLDVAYGKSALFPRRSSTPPVSVDNGVRAPNPRVSLSAASTGYLYDAMKGAKYFHVLVFASSLQGQTLHNVKQFASALNDPDSWYTRFGGRDVFNVVLVTKRLPFEIETFMAGSEWDALKDIATIVYDDQAPDEDAHTTWGVDHGTGAVVVVRPDLWVGNSVRPDEVTTLNEYFGAFLVPQTTAVKEKSVDGADDVNGVNGVNGGIIEGLKEKIANGFSGLNGINGTHSAGDVKSVNGANDINGTDSAVPSKKVENANGADGVDAEMLQRIGSMMVNLYKEVAGAGSR
jgi:phenol 2-monooxygenase